MVTRALKVRKIGNSVGVILPRDVQEALRVSDGDTLYTNVTKDSIELSPYDPDFAESMKAFERTRRKYRNALKELGK
ncbi:MAG: putative addiction module antidote [Planctomycetota bacterium]|jgi:putative addiction module antidote